jgi:hypothetical protein
MFPEILRETFSFRRAQGSKRSIECGGATACAAESVALGHSVLVIDLGVVASFI